MCVCVCVCAESLPTFITSHLSEKSCLPCKLILPEDVSASSSSRVARRPAGDVAKAIQSGACKFPVYGRSSTHAHKLEYKKV